MTKQFPSQREFELLCLVFRERNGREVAQRHKEATGSEISYGTLYTTFRRLKDLGWVTVREDEDADGRLRFFEITKDGAKAVSAWRERARAFAGHGRGVAERASTVVQDLIWYWRGARRCARKEA